MAFFKAVAFSRTAGEAQRYTKNTLRLTINMSSDNSLTNSDSITLKLVVLYFLLSALFSLISPFLTAPVVRYLSLDQWFFSKYPFNSTKYQFIVFIKFLPMNIAYMVCSIALFKRKRWARGLGLFLICYSAFNGIVLSYVDLRLSIVMSVWYGIWFFLLFNKRTKNAIFSSSVTEGYNKANEADVKKPGGSP